ncbi:glycosyltransferase [Williamsia sp. M5A3_1d]
MNNYSPKQDPEHLLGRETCTLVCATHDRLAALQHTIKNKLEINGVTNLLFVLDGCTDGTEEFLREVSKIDSRVSFIKQDRGGAQAARNRGIQLAVTDWILLVDDDDLVPADYAQTLKAAAVAHGAVLAGAPWFNATSESIEEVRRRFTDAPRRHIGLRDGPSTVTLREIVTPYLFSAILIDAAIAKAYLYDSNYRGNSWREETDLFLRVWADGHKIVRSCATHSWQDRRFGGGHSRSAIRYEAWVLRNELFFGKRHDKTLRQLETSWKGWKREGFKTSFERIRVRAKASVIARSRRVYLSNRPRIQLSRYVDEFADRQVVIVTPSVDPRAGGVERFCVDLAAVLGDSGWRIRTVAPRKEEHRWLRRLGLEAVREAVSLRREIRELRPSVLITNGQLGFFPAMGCPRVHVFHGTMVQNSLCTRRGRRFRDWAVASALGGGLAEFLSGLGTARVAVSKSSAREVRRWYRMGLPSVVGNAVPVSHYASPTKPPSGLVFAGRRENRKGYETAVEVANLAGKRLKVAGPGSDSRTQDLGVLDRDELLTLLAQSSALLLPSLYEACSYLILESLSVGCPVITTRTGWIEELLEVVPGYALLVVDPNDIAAMVKLLALCESRDSEVVKVVAQARVFVENHNSMSTFAEAWSTLIADITQVA